MADLVLPQLGETVTEGTITRWFKNPGDAISVGEMLYEVSTDKVDSEVPSPMEGVISEIRVPVGETVNVGTVLAIVELAEGAVAPPPDAAVPVPSAAPAEPAAAPAPPAAPAGGARRRRRAPPRPPPAAGPPAPPRQCACRCCTGQWLGERPRQSFALARRPAPGSGAGSRPRRARGNRGRRPHHAIRRAQRDRRAATRCRCECGSGNVAAESGGRRTPVSTERAAGAGTGRRRGRC